MFTAQQLNFSREYIHVYTTVCTAEYLADIYFNPSEHTAQINDALCYTKQRHLK